MVQSEPRPETERASSFEDLLVEALGALEDHGTAGLDGLLAQQPQHASALRARIAELGRLGLVDSAASRAGARAERMGDFRLIAELGGGGMGVVFEAEQESLKRRVALKLIRPELLWFGGSRARFRREIEAVAQLSHPGIVPIYTVGEEQGVPFFAMELVEGCTLAQVITDLHDRPVSKLSGADLLAAVDRCARRTQAAGDTSSALAIAPDASWTDTVVRLMRQIAEALEHTHSRGVVHRDIKPSNIVVTRSGRAMLIDFGLASKEGAERITRSGSAGGSMAYMSPEQVRGGDVDPRTDIYSLGVSFAELLTLRPLFKAGSVDLLWKAILEGNYARPRSLVPSLPWDVETVCLTAMEAERERRYTTAGDLARDLSNLLARRPIDARRAGWTLRSLRWAQRHPRLCAAMLVGVVFGLAGVLVFARQQQVLGRRIGEQRDVALAHARELRSLASGFVFDVHEKISRLPGATEAREMVVTQAQSLFDTLAKASAQDPSLSRDLAFADLRLGSILDRTYGGTLGQRGSAREHLERAWKYFDEHARDAQASLEDRRVLCQAGQAFGSYLSKSGDAEAGTLVLRQACEDSKLLALASTATLDDQLRVAALELYLAQNQERRGLSEESRALFESALAKLEGLEQAHPGEVKLLRLMPRACLLLANSFDQADQPGRARELFERGIAAGDRLLQLEPLAPDNRRFRANCIEGLGGAQLRADQSEQSRASLMLAAEVYDELRREDPRDGQMVIEITRCLASLSDACGNCGDHEAAILASERALAVLESVPEDALQELRTRRLSVLASLAGALADVDRGEEALLRLREADALAQVLHATHPRDLYTNATGAQLLRELGELLRERGEIEEAVETHARALAAYTRWRELVPGRGLAFSEGAFERALYARALCMHEEIEPGLEQYRLAVGELGETLQASQSDVMLLGRAAFGFLEAAQALGNHGHADEARDCAQRAWVWIERLADLGGDSETALVYSRAASELLAEGFAAEGDAQQALEWQRRGLSLQVRVARGAGAPPIELVLAAKELLEGEVLELRDPDLALELCRLAVQRAPEQAVPHLYLAKALREQGDQPAALAAARAGLELVPKDDPGQAKVLLRLQELIAELE